ncbi:MAG: sensor histidine kinase [Anaerolineae bacterium]
MNRLRVRFSLAFIGVIFLVVALPLIIGVAVTYFDPDIAQRRPEIIQEIPTETLERLREAARRAIPFEIMRLSLIGAAVGIGAGMWMAKSLAEPLSRLADATKAIGRRDFSRRVAESGTEEMQAVAHAFNEMASELEQAETVRQNMLADVAHELRTPITVIQGNLRAMLDGVYPLTPEEVAQLYDQTRLLTRMVDDLRVLAQAEAHQLPLNRVAVNVAELVEETAVSFRPLAQQQEITLRVELLGKLPTIQADRDRLAQSVQNLLNNALRHTPPGGYVCLQLEQTADWVEIRVRDDGEGIAPDHLPHVFDRFYRTDKARARDTGGAGLGLAIVKAIVETHDGRVLAHSNGSGQGSTFTIQLPVSNE